MTEIFFQKYGCSVSRLFCEKLESDKRCHQHSITVTLGVFSQLVYSGSDSEMARYGEGDKRWIVEERPDGTNVHNWHWAETDCLDWSRATINDLLSNLTILNGEGGLFVRTKNVENVVGEAYVNIRKGKVIPGYELKISVPWSAEARDSEDTCLGSAEGMAEIPYLSVENAGEDPEVKFSVKEESDIGKRAKDAMLLMGKDIIFKKIREYVEKMAKGGPMEETELKKTQLKPVKKAMEAMGTKEVMMKEVTSAKADGRLKTLSWVEKFNCRAAVVYEMLMDENKWKGFTGSNTKISKDVGGTIELFEGAVVGSNLELKKDKLIVQRWRFTSWPENMHSTVRLDFNGEGDVTNVTLTHTGIPEEDRYGNNTVAENVEKGWRDIIFRRLQMLIQTGF